MATSGEIYAMLDVHIIRQITNNHCMFMLPYTHSQHDVMLLLCYITCLMVFINVQC